MKSSYSWLEQTKKRQVLHKESLNLKPLIADIAKDTQLIAPQHTITCTHNDDGYIFADELVMRQMLRIFLDNSIKYTPDGGKNHHFLRK